VIIAAVDAGDNSPAPSSSSMRPKPNPAAAAAPTAGHSLSNTNPKPIRIVRRSSIVIDHRHLAAMQNAHDGAGDLTCLHQRTDRLGQLLSVHRLIVTATRVVSTIGPRHPMVRTGRRSGRGVA